MLNLLFLDSMGKSPHGQAKDSLEKNLRWYSPIRVWFVITLVTLAHIVLEWPKYLSYELPFISVSMVVILLLSTGSKKFLPL